MSIQTEITRIQNAKLAIKEAINSKGGTLTNELLNEYAEAINNLPSGKEGMSDLEFFDWTMILSNN